MALDSKTIAYVLSAGRGLRLGGICKGRILVDGTPLLTRQVLALLDSGLHQITVVCGHEAQIIEGLVKDLASELAKTAKTEDSPTVVCCLRAPETQANNPRGRDADDGIQASVGAAITDAQRLMSADPGIDGVMIGLVDLPLLGATDIKHLFKTTAKTSADALIPISPEGNPGHPIWLSRRLVGKIKPQEPGFSLRNTLRDLACGQPEHVLKMKTERPGYFVDLDTPECIERLHRDWGIQVRIP